MNKFDYEEGGSNDMKKIRFLIPAIVTVFVILIIYFLGIRNITLENIEFVLNAVITCVTTMSGFILTSISILIGLSNSRVMQTIAKKNAIGELVFRYTEPLIVGLMLIIACVALGALVPDNKTIGCVWAYCFVGLSVYYIVSMIITGKYLLKILHEILVEPQRLKSSATPSVPPGEFPHGQ